MCVDQQEVNEDDFVASLPRTAGDYAGDYGNAWCNHVAKD